MPPLRKCPSCRKNALKKLVSAPVFRLKGGGWYETDFKSDQETKRNLAEKAEASESKPAESGAESKPAEGKAEAKADKADAKPTKPAAKPEAKPAARSSARKSAARKTPVHRPAESQIARLAPRARGAGESWRMSLPG